MYFECCYKSSIVSIYTMLTDISVANVAVGAKLYALILVKYHAHLTYSGYFFIFTTFHNKSSKLNPDFIPGKVYC